jgi:hypothetical protein
MTVLRSLNQRYANSEALRLDNGVTDPLVFVMNASLQGTEPRGLSEPSVVASTRHGHRVRIGAAFASPMATAPCCDVNEFDGALATRATGSGRALLDEMVLAACELALEAAVSGVSPVHCGGLH